MLISCEGVRDGTREGTGNKSDWRPFLDSRRLRLSSRPSTISCVCVAMCESQFTHRERERRVIQSCTHEAEVESSAVTACHSQCV